MKNNLILSYKKNKFRNYINFKLREEKTILFKNIFKSLQPNTFLAFIDEVGFNCNMKPLYSWSTKGKIQHLNIKLDNKNTKNKSVCACITLNGDIKYRIQNTPYTKSSFINFLKTLNLPVNTLILLDNVRFHHSKDVLDYINTKGWKLLFIPPYSPNFNPIENVFSCIKSYYRKNKNINHSFSKLTSTTIINSINHMINNLDSFYT